jgi:type I restriction enzyme, S subunit
MKNAEHIRKFEDVCELVGGSQPSKDHFIYQPKDGYIRLIQVRDYRTEKFITYIPKDKARRFCNKDDIMIGRYGPPIFGIFKGLEGAYNVALMKAVVNEKICNKKYFYWFLKTDKLRQFVEHSSKRAAGQDGVRKELLDKYPVFLPPSPEQKRIVAILDKAFAAIAKAKANAEQNCKNAKEIFEGYLQKVFEEKREGWEEKSLGEIADVIGGYSFKSTDFKTEGKYQVLRMGNVRPGIIRENESPVYIDNLDKAVLKRALLLKNDVIITQTGTKNKRDYGFTVIIENENYLLNQRISAIRFSKNYLSKFFLYFSWTNIFKNQYFANETGTVGQGNVGIGAITSAVIPFTSIKTQQSIVKKLDHLSIETKKLEAIYKQKINDLEELKKSILEKAFKGEL